MPENRNEDLNDEEAKKKKKREQEEKEKRDVPKLSIKMTIDSLVMFDDDKK